MNNSSNQPYNGHTASYKAEQLDSASMGVLEELRQLTTMIPKPNRLPIILTLHDLGRARIRQETIILAVLALATSALDHETGDHTQRVMWLTEVMARQLALSDEEFYLLRLAALLHDIGKIGIPEVILLKPGPLTKKEWNLIQRHPEIGRQILERSGDLFHPVASIVVAHHEHWDGSGYPSGVMKEEIPFSARILAVVDSYDAMTSPRVYKRHPRSVAQSKVELQRCAGSQFDPPVVEAFLHGLEKREKTLCSSPESTISPSRSAHIFNTSVKRRCGV